MFDIDIVGDRITVHMAPGLDEPLRLSAAEATRLVLTLAAVVDVLGDQLPALSAAVGKIREAAGLDEGMVAATVDADNRLADLQAAIDDGVQVQLVYRGRHDELARNRLIDPWRLEFTADGWYLHGRDHERDDHRVFLVDRIQQVGVRSARATSTAPPDLPSPQWTPTADAQQVHLRLTGGARVLGDRVALLVDDDDAGVRDVVFETDSLGWASELVAAAGDGVEIVSPPALATLVAVHGERGLAAMADCPAPGDQA